LPHDLSFNPNLSKIQLNKTTNNIVVSWLDSPELEQKYTQYEKTTEAKPDIIDQ
jgi:hypothetical protein